MQTGSSQCHSYLTRGCLSIDEPSLIGCYRPIFCLIVMHSTRRGASHEPGKRRGVEISAEYWLLMTFSTVSWAGDPGIRPPCQQTQLGHHVDPVSNGQSRSITITKTITIMSGVFEFGRQTNPAGRRPPRGVCRGAFSGGAGGRPGVLLSL